MRVKNRKLRTPRSASCALFEEYAANGVGTHDGDRSDETHNMMMATAPAAAVLRSVDVQPLSFMRIHHVQLTSSLGKHSKKLGHNISANPSNTVTDRLMPTGQQLQKPCRGWMWRLHLQWKLNAWMKILMCSVMLCLVGRVTAEMVTTARGANHLANGVSGHNDWYVVLVSIPVLDKILPLKWLAEELLDRGYRVGFALPENCRHFVNDLERLEFISLGNIVGKGRATYLDIGELQTLGVYESYAATMRYYASFQRPMFSALVEDLEDDRPNLVIVDRYAFAGVDAAHALQIPYVVNAPHLLFEMDAPPAYVPAPFSNYSMHTTSVLERCLNSYYRLYFRLTQVQIMKEVNLIRQEHGLQPVICKEQLYGQQLVLVNSVFGLDATRPISPNFQMVGILQPKKEHLQEFALLPEDFISWLTHDTSTKPIVLINFQADIPLSPEFVTVLINALEPIDARLVWKVTLQEQTVFDFRSWTRSGLFFLNADVDDMVLMENVSIGALVTAGEFRILQHALVMGIPILGVPFSAEQLEAVNAIVRAGAGLVVDSRSFTETRVAAAVQLLLQNASYENSAMHLGELLLTGGGAARAVDHIESVMEFGADYLVPVRNTQLLYKTYLMDVYLVYGIILCGAAVILRTVASVICSIFQPASFVPISAEPKDASA